jgi:hypothetical protein
MKKGSRFYVGMGEGVHLVVRWGGWGGTSVVRTEIRHWYVSKCCKMGEFPGLHYENKRGQPSGQGSLGNEGASCMNG